VESRDADSSAASPEVGRCARTRGGVRANALFRLEERELGYRGADHCSPVLLVSGHSGESRNGAQKAAAVR
jgi:hypothetical protein